MKLPEASEKYSCIFLPLEMANWYVKFNYETNEWDTYSKFTHLRREVPFNVYAKYDGSDKWEQYEDSRSHQERIIALLDEFTNSLPSRKKYRTEEVQDQMIRIMKEIRQMNIPTFDAINMPAEDSEELVKEKTL